jgi:hypothetical protein
MKITSPQMQVRQFVKDMYPDKNVEVAGYRASMKRAGGKRPPYTAQLFLDGKVVLSAQERNWRQAYKTLQIMISKGNIL